MKISIYRSNDEIISTDNEAYYETVASREEIYREEVEEDLRSILVFDDTTCFVTGKYEEPEMLRLEVATRL